MGKSIVESSDCDMMKNKKSSFQLLKHCIFNFKKVVSKIIAVY